MKRCYRIAAYILLLVLGSSLGDWPYVDEILQQVAPHQRTMDPSAGSDAPIAAPAPLGQLKFDRMQVFGVLLGLQALTRTRMEIAIVAATPAFAPPVFFPPAHFPESPFRPPAGASRV